MWSLTQGSTNSVSSGVKLWLGGSSLQLSPALTVLSPTFEDAALIKVCPNPYSNSFFYVSLLLSPAYPLPSLCGPADLPVNLCGYSEPCLSYWKHPSNTPISHHVKMIGCALFEYPFPIAGHDWREQPEMMGLLRDTAKKEKLKCVCVCGEGGANKEKTERKENSERKQ